MRGSSPSVDSSSASSCGEMVSRSQPASSRDLADVAEARAHHHGLVAEFLEVVVDARHRLHAGIVGAVVVLAGVFLVPVENAAHEGRDERDAGIGRGNGLVQAEEQRQVAVDAFLLQHFGGANALPGGSDLDQHAVAADARLRRTAR